MGIDNVALDQILRLKQGGESLGTVMELGAQYVVGRDDPKKVKSFIEAFGGDAGGYQALSDSGSARDLYRRIGMQYQCIDTSGEFGALPLDLNVDGVPAEHVGRYDLVTNFGTTEHVFNQLNVLKVIHDLTKPGGVMIHGVPFTGWTVHGLYNYTPKFFWCLQEQNQYELVRLYVHGYRLPSFHYRTLFKRIACNLTPWLFTTNSVIYCTLRKRHNNPFIMPWDGLASAMTAEQKQKYVVI